MGDVTSPQWQSVSDFSVAARRQTLSRSQLGSLTVPLCDRGFHSPLTQAFSQTSRDVGTDSPAFEELDRRPRTTMCLFDAVFFLRNVAIVTYICRHSCRLRFASFSSMSRSPVHTSSFSNCASRPQRPRGLLGWDGGAQDDHLDFHTAPELLILLLLMLLYVHRNHLDFHTASELSWHTRFSVALHPQKLLGLLGTGSPGRPPRLSHSS